MTAMNPLPSPCIKVCKINPASGFCLGCYRRREEIKAWRDMSAPDTHSLAATLAARRKAVIG